MAKRRILIVDDEADIRSIIRATLSSKYETVEAHDGLDALEKLELAEPDFAILDVMMPLMDGFETCRSIRRHPRYKDLSVLFLSALSARSDIKQGYEAGANLYLTKPFDPSRLLRNVDAFFEGRPAEVAPKRYTLEQLQELQRQGPAAIAAAKSPEAKPCQETAEKQPPASPPCAADPLCPHPRLLVVDDDEEMLRMAVVAFSGEYEILTASDGMEAIRKITAYQPDLIVLDGMMPKMSGYQLCQSLRQNVRFSKTPILFVSARSTPRDRDYALRIGGTDFLAKPCDMWQLRDRLEAFKSAPGFVVHPKTLTYRQIQDIDNRRKEELELRQDRLLRKEESELEKFLRENA